MDTQLAKYAQLIKETDLFSYPKAWGWDINKELLFLAAAQAKPVSGIEAYHIDPTAKNGRVAVESDIPRITELLDQLDVFYKYEIKDSFIRFTVAHTKSDLQTYLDTDHDDKKALGDIYGFPETATQAFIDRNMREMSEETRTPIYFRTSVDHWQEEYKTIEKWDKILKEYGLT